MRRSFPPSSLAEYTAEQILSRNSAKGHLIYCALVGLVMVTLLLLPVLKVTVSVQGTGIIRPMSEKNEIKLLVSGTVSEIFVEENQQVKKDQTLLTIDTSVLDEKSNLIHYEEKEQTLIRNDLEILTKDAAKFSISAKSLKTVDYRSDFLLFKNKLKENSFSLKKAKKELDRCKLLIKNQLASVSDLESAELSLSKLNIQHEMLIDQQISKWNKCLLACRLKLKQLQTQHQQIEKEKELCTVKSPISGTLEQFSGISQGSYVQTGQLLAIVSPDSDLLAEVYVSPDNIGMIHTGTKARIQIDAFNYNQWGLISGSVQKISDDFIPVQNKPYFKVKCKLDQTYLELKNGYKGYLKKGMTIRTRFLITKRSLFQLLYDKVDDWLNPLQKQF